MLHPWRAESICSNKKKQLHKITNLFWRGAGNEKKQECSDIKIIWQMTKLLCM